MSATFVNRIRAGGVGRARTGSLLGKGHGHPGRGSSPRASAGKGGRRKEPGAALFQRPKIKPRETSRT